ncbi:hypothetical protein AAFF_G00243750 [Aldrovandia affinis]|uniref:Uncharacterized protein n=1 Tax=Aldrovandia affinis TaxID=143900 RepID=A0AAD7RDZ8_9TELE|nr:hypothetical protein AAFF_G00243750 [Aldrovandia affinis]
MHSGSCACGRGSAPCHISPSYQCRAHLYHHVTATVPPHNLGQVLGTGEGGAPPPGPTHGEQRLKWQLQAVQCLLQSAEFMDNTVDRPELTLSKFEKDALQELVEVLEPFQEAMDMVSRGKHMSISLALPCVLGIHKYLAEMVTRQCTSMTPLRLAGIRALVIMWGTRILTEHPGDIRGSVHTLPP